MPLLTKPINLRIFHCVVKRRVSKLGRLDAPFLLCLRYVGSFYFFLCLPVRISLSTSGIVMADAFLREPLLQSLVCVGFHSWFTSVFMEALYFPSKLCTVLTACSEWSPRNVLTLPALSLSFYLSLVCVDFICSQWSLAIPSTFFIPSLVL